jgi:hypothetical protein
VRIPKADLENAFRELLVRLQPRPEYLRLFNAIVLDAWNERRASSRTARAKLEQQIATLRHRLDDLDEAFLYGKRIDQQTYERQRDRLREQLGLAEIDLAEATGEELDIDAVLAFAQHVLTDAARMWEQTTFDQRLRLQRALFPEGVSFDGSEIRTTVTCLAYGQLSAPQSAENGLASPTGFEPAPDPGDTHASRPQS